MYFEIRIQCFRAKSHEIASFWYGKQREGLVGIHTSIEHEIEHMSK